MDKDPLKPIREQLIKLAYTGDASIQEEKYLYEIADKFSNKKKNYNPARSIVLDIHILSEFFLKVAITICASIGAHQLGKQPYITDFLEIFQKKPDLGYSTKLEIVEKLEVFSSDSIEILCSINYLRNSFAHGYDVMSTRFEYFDESIFEKNTIEKIIVDFKKVQKEFGQLLVQAAKKDKKVIVELSKIKE